MKIGVYVEITDPRESTLTLWHEVEQALTNTVQHHCTRLLYVVPDNDEEVDVQIQAKFGWQE